MAAIEALFLVTVNHVRSKGGGRDVGGQDVTTAQVYPDGFPEQGWAYTGSHNVFENPHSSGVKDGRK